MSLTTNLICGSRPAEGLVVHQPGYAGVLSAHRAAGLLGPQLDGPEPGILTVKHHQLLAAGSWHDPGVKEKRPLGEKKASRIFWRQLWRCMCVAKQDRRAGWGYYSLMRDSILARERCSHNSFLRVLIGMTNEESAESRECRGKYFCLFLLYFIRQAQSSLPVLNFATMKPLSALLPDD